MRKYILPFCENELNLRYTFLNGQCFNWAEPSLGLFCGVAFQRYLEVTRLDSKTIEVSVEPDLEDLPKVFDQYLYRPIMLSNMYKEWTKCDSHFGNLAQKLPGTRIIDQDPWECTISFICSSNNNISRIMSLLKKLRTKYGKKIAERTLDGNSVGYHEFPGIEELRSATEEDLKELGFGYRAGFVIQSIRTIDANGGQKWIRGLKNGSYQDIKDKLMSLKGVGRKVADCICLFSMGCHQSVPIDTHMFQVAKKLGYITETQTKKSLSLGLYNKIADSYRNVYGGYAGWAQQIIFTGDLSNYKAVVESSQQSTVAVKKKK